MPQNEDYNLPANFYTSVNLTEELSDEELNALGSRMKAQIEVDINSRRAWLERNDTWMELVTQVMEAKSYPWPDAANIKFPLVATAAIQFHARAFPSLLGNSKPVKAKIIGRDPQGIKAARASRVSTYLSHQITDVIPNWMDDMDRLLFIVPIIGSLYKKTYHSEITGSPASELVLPRDLIINYDAMSVKDARKSHRIWKTPNAIVSMQNRGLYRELPDEEDGAKIDLPKTRSETHDKIQGKSNPGTIDEDALQELFEVHVLLDLDDDGYKEPYICTIRETDGKIYRIKANYTSESIETIGSKIVEITPKEYFTHYFFLPDPESATHGIGFGTMVGPLNEAVNTIMNQLLDAGHMNTLGGGFLSRGLRIKGGALRFKPQEWKTINASGDDLRKSIFPMPTKEPSTVLFQLLGLLIDSAKDLSSVQDQMVGKTPGQNTPHSTTEAVMEQGLKVFNGIYKRLYRSMTSEFQKIYDLVRENPDPASYMNVLDRDGRDAQEAIDNSNIEEVLEFLMADFKADDMTVIPTAEPDMIQEAQKIARGQALLQKVAGGVRLNTAEVVKRVLEAEGHEDIPTLMDAPPPQPDIDQQLDIAKLQHQKQIDGMETKLMALKTRAEVLAIETETQLKMAELQQAGIEGIQSTYVAQKELMQKDYENITKRLKVLVDGHKIEVADKQAKRVEGSSK